MNKPIVFLDIDDVLNNPTNKGLGFDTVVGFLKLNTPEKFTTQELTDIRLQLEKDAQRAFTQEAKDVLKRIIDTYQAKVVLSTSWRVLLRKEQFEQLFQWTGLDFIELHECWHTPLQMGGNNRLLEIQAWLEQQAEKPGCYLILDDTDSGAPLKSAEKWAEFGSRTVFCDQCPFDDDLIIHKGLHADHWHLIEDILKKAKL